eukprot:gene27113-33791_t
MISTSVTSGSQDIDLSTASTGITIAGSSDASDGDNCLSGYSVKSAGDINNDGFVDFIIGAPYCGSSTGAAYVLYGDIVTAVTLGLK